ncbi:lipase family protein [Paraburkholderia unamae]|uniref:Lipase family protein n=1 Tax=Paraburkholderia unamae TaxID=219649 RepID=A0ACC6RGZ5_9BURK
MTPYDYGLLAQEAYTSKPDIGVEDSASRAIVRQTAAGLVVAFPGTNNIPCWVADLDGMTTFVSGAGELHKGFWDAWQAIAPAVKAAVAGRPVTFVGHSLGAAIAQMAALDFVIAGTPPRAVYGFEPPRICTTAAARAALSHVPVYLYHNGKDLVPEVPIGFQHGAYPEDIGTPCWPIPNISDHMMARVLKALPGYANAQH